MAGPEAEASRREEDSDDEEVLVQRMRDRIGHQHATVQGNPSSAPPGAGRNHSPPPDQPASSEGEFASDFQAMEAAQFQARLSAEAKVQAAELDAASDASDGPVDPSEDPSDTSPESREVRVAKRTVRPPDVHPSTDFNPVSGHSKHAVFGTSGRWGGGVADGAKQASQPNKTFGHADVSSIQEVSGVDAWLSKRAGEPGSSPIPEESADGRRAEPPSALTVGRQPSPERRKKEIYTPEPMERLPSERKVFAASFSTTPRGDVHAAQKIARHGSVHQHTAQEEEEMFQHDSGGWSNVRWSADVSKMLGKDTHSRTQHRDLYGQTEEDKELIRQQIERTRLLAEEEERIRNTPSSVTNPRWKHSINAVPVPAPKPAPKRPPKVQTSPRPAVGRKEGGPSSPFLASARDDLYSHRTTGSPRPGQLHSSDLNETLPLRSETETDNDGDNAGGENAGDDARGVGWMLNHEIRPFEGDSEVVKVAKQRWGAQLLGSGGAKASQAEESALGYSPKASRDGDSQCHTKSKPDGQIQAVRWVQGDRDDRFDRSSVHHPDHYKRLLFGTTYDSQMRVAQNLHSETHKSKGSHVAHMNRHGKAARRNGQFTGRQKRWWSRSEGYFDVRKRCGYEPQQQRLGGAAAQTKQPEHEQRHSNGAGSHQPRQYEPEPEPEMRGRAQEGHGDGDEEDAESDRSWGSLVEQVGGMIQTIPEARGVAIRTTRAVQHPLSSSPKQAPSCEEVTGEDAHIWEGREQRHVGRKPSPYMGTPPTAKIAAAPGAGSSERTRSWVRSNA